VFRLLMTPTRAGLRAIGLATQLFLRTVSKVVGGTIVEEAIAFFAAFEGMEQGFRDRAAKVEELLVDGTTAFVVVSSPRREAVEETLFFADRLGQTTAQVEALIVNRVFPNFGPVPRALLPGAGQDGSGDPGPVAEELAAPAGAGHGGSNEPGPEAAEQPVAPELAALAALATNMAELDRVASREQDQVRLLSERLPGAVVIQVPFLADDVHDVDGLTQVCRWLFDQQP
jgi:anion-transporting  ArsA/GET3 family ATPase